MTVLLWSIVLIFSAFVLQLVIWKIRLPGRQTKTMLSIFFGVLITGCIVLSYSPVSIFGIRAPSGILEFLHVGLFFTSFTLAYMITYTAMEVDSPSLVMITSIAQAGPEGLTKEDFFNSLNDDILVKPRIRDMLRDEMARLEGGRYYLTPKGAVFARIFIFFRSLLKAQKGG